MVAYERVLKQYLPEKKNGYLQSGRLREVVARRELTALKCQTEKRLSKSFDKMYTLGVPGLEILTFPGLRALGQGLAVKYQ